jgi:transcription elongation factor/antiterminator RfaH
MIDWYAIQSKARKEDLVCEQLSIRNVEIFFPRIRVQPVNPRARKVKPYFPGYVFGRFDLEQIGRSCLDWIPGAIGIVNFGAEPVPVSDHIITTLQQHLKVINASATKMAEMFQKGDVIAIQGGIFAGYEAIFDARLPGRDRVEVLLNMLQGQQLRVELPIEQVTLKKGTVH